MHWSDAVVHAAYLINRTPIWPLNGGVAEEYWRGRRVRLEGVWKLMSISSNQRSKLDPKRKRMFFVSNKHLAIFSETRKPRNAIF